MQSEAIEKQLSELCDRLGDGWTVGFQFHGAVEGWTVVVAYGVNACVMWESESYRTLEDALNQATSQQKRILRELGA